MIIDSKLHFRLEGNQTEEITNSHDNQIKVFIHRLFGSCTTFCISKCNSPNAAAT